MAELMTAIALWCKVSNIYLSSIQECQTRIARCVTQQKTDMDRQYCFYQPAEKPLPVFAREKEKQ